jgi:hypothetical protein
MNSNIKTVGLYGGAIEVALPTEFIDASSIRQVPDFQEVYLHSTFEISIIFELLEHTEKDIKDSLLEHYEIVYEQTFKGESYLYEEFGVIKVGDVIMGLKPLEESDFLITVNGEFSLDMLLALMKSIKLVDKKLFS